MAVISVFDKIMIIIFFGESGKLKLNVNKTGIICRRKENNILKMVYICRPTELSANWNSRKVGVWIGYSGHTCVSLECLTGGVSIRQRSWSWLFWRLYLYEQDFKTHLRLLLRLNVAVSGVSWVLVVGVWL